MKKNTSLRITRHVCNITLLCMLLTIFYFAGISLGRWDVIQVPFIIHLSSNPLCTICNLIVFSCHFLLFLKVVNHIQLLEKDCYIEAWFQSLCKLMVYSALFIGVVQMISCWILLGECYLDLTQILPWVLIGFASYCCSKQLYAEPEYVVCQKNRFTQTILDWVALEEEQGGK